MHVFPLCMGELIVELEVTDDRFFDQMTAMLEGFEAPCVDHPMRHRVVLTTEPWEPRQDDTGELFTPLSYDEATGLYHAENGFYALEVQSGPQQTTIHIKERTSPPLWPVNLMRMLARFAVCLAASHHGAILVHGCAMVPPNGDCAYLFIGPSGAGKTTMTRRLKGWTSLGDDTVLVRYCEDEHQTYVCGTPLPGRECLPRLGAELPVKELFLLEPNAAELAVKPLSVEQRMPLLMQQVFSPIDSGPLLASILETTTRIVTTSSLSILGSSLNHRLGLSVFSQRALG